MFILLGCFENNENRMADSFDTQGHRGARGRFPENSIPAFEEAVRQGMRTVELDLAVSKDKQLVVSHEPWFNPDICMLENSAYTEDTSLYGLTYDDIAKIDCGSKGNKDYPQQESMVTVKPLFFQVVAACDSLATAMGRSLPFYNIEIKSRPSYDGRFTPEIVEFTALVYSELVRLSIENRVTIQSFDVRGLQQMKALDPNIKNALLSESALSYKRDIEELGFEPNIYSPYHLTLRPEHVAELHDRNIEVIPWTVNDLTRMRTLIDWGVDGIISDYPDRLASVAPR